MTVACNVLHDHFGIDLHDPDPDADYTCEQRECGAVASYGDRHQAGSGLPGTFVCGDCYHAMTEEQRIDIWPLNKEHLPPRLEQGQ